MIKILVIDRHYADYIIRSLEEYIEDDIICFKHEPPEEVKIDLFIISGKRITDKDINVKDLKIRFGSKESKVLAVSTIEEVLDEISRNPDFGVDHALPKEKVMDVAFAVTGRKLGNVDIMSNLKDILPVCQ